jgi:HlyD family secretion protein
MKTESGFAWSHYLGLGSKVALALGVVAAAAYWLWFTPMHVQRHTIKSEELVAEVMGTGTLEAHEKATISTKIPGRLKVLLVDQGDIVKAGQEVARLDDRDLGHEVEIEEANVAAKQAAVERLQADLMVTKANLEQATTSHARAMRLVASKAISQDEVDKATESFGVAKANHARAEAALSEGRKQVVVAGRMREFRQARLDDAVIKSPFDAVIVRRDRYLGDVVVPGTSILAIVSPEELWISAWVDESSMADVRPDQPARVVFRSRPNLSLEGKVIRLGRETDRETREFLVDVAPARLPPDWSVGQRAEVYLEIARKHAEVVAPLKCIAWHDRQPTVFLEVNGRAEQRSVKLGIRSRDAVEILEGLSVNDVVLTPARPGTTLTDGQRVQTP